MHGGCYGGTAPISVSQLAEVDRRHKVQWRVVYDAANEIKTPHFPLFMLYSFVSIYIKRSPIIGMPYVMIC